MNIQHQESKLLELPSDLICDDLAALKEQLLNSLTTAEPAVISGRLVTRVGTAALQLLVAFRRECAARAVQFELREASSALLDAIACTGLAGELGLSLTTH